jgi:cell division protein FtsB
MGEGRGGVLLNRVGNTYWLSNRQLTQSAATQSLPVRDFSSEVLPATLGLLRLLPSWIFLAMILIATLGICATVVVRARAELQASSLQLDRMTSEIDAIRRSNAALRVEIHRMTNDPGMIESAARERLGMVRPNDIVLPMDSVRTVSNLGTISFVR